LVDDPPQVAITEYVPAAEQDVTSQCPITLPFFRMDSFECPFQGSMVCCFQSEYPKRFLGPIDFPARNMPATTARVAQSLGFRQVSVIPPERSSARLPSVLSSASRNARCTDGATLDVGFANLENA
jgi:hypothetical protein